MAGAVSDAAERAQLADELVVQAMVGLEGLRGLLRLSNRIRNGDPIEPASVRRHADRVVRDCYEAA